MKAAVLHSLDAPPRYEEAPEPLPVENEVLVHVTAAALNPSTRLLASGKYYPSSRKLPTVCGVEGVGRLDDGTRVFFGVRRPPNGSMSKRTAVPQALCWPLPNGVSDAIAAALPNPGLSSWCSWSQLRDSNLAKPYWFTELAEGSASPRCSWRVLQVCA